jgi:hypothetical protein
MIIIKKIAFGNTQEAFIENRLTENVNIIFSNDNNKGKTLLIQGLLFSMGNEPIFPSGFNYLEYYFYSKISFNGLDFEFLRKNKTTIVKSRTEVRITESLSELKYYINKNIFGLPSIIKNGQDKLVDLYLFYQLFFIGQDKRDTSKIINSGQYNKNDFLSMLATLNGTKQTFLSEDDIETVRKRIKNLKTEIRVLDKKMKFAKENPDIAEHSLASADQESYDKYSKVLAETAKQMASYRNLRSRETNRKLKLEALLTELNSLNQKIEVGKVKCAKCGSDKIIYTNGDVSFEVSNAEVKNSIISSIKEQIAEKGDIISELIDSIRIEGEMQTKLLNEIPPRMRNILAFSDEIISAEKYDIEKVKVKNEIASLHSELEQKAEVDSEVKRKNAEMIDTLTKSLEYYFKIIDPDGNQNIDKLFTKNGENFSGSEGQVFYFSKLIALNSYFKHQFPIIIDSYRSGELSSQKEMKMIEFYKKANKQVILTSTLKSAEYDRPDYREYEGINIIDYSTHQNSKILSPDFVQDFTQILTDFNIYESENDDN